MLIIQFKLNRYQTFQRPKEQYLVPKLSQLQINGEPLYNLEIWEYYRYHLAIPKLPREALSMQDLAGGDNNRTPVIF